MDRTILIQRKARAVTRIVASAKALAERLDLSPALVDGLQPKGTRDPQVLEMKRLEGVAALLEQLTIDAGAVQTEVSVGFPLDLDTQGLSNVLATGIIEPADSQDSEPGQAETVSAETPELEAGASTDESPEPTVPESAPEEESPAPVEKPARRRSTKTSSKTSKKR
jgi:hypothetical protein